ncbi:type VII secretion integral membrane protein EccD [Mycobacterium sp. 1245801.1]|uniref:type VII secretion integral membrane protein EccD n=1 Tax=Mycobacterium sp. 1245801.1 TaxID=1834075 RepID=UPI0007FEDBA1|nr:type VII secretion integral membrane protein EccD [Mycobacterium sp. 1245801.1]OBJ17555.1 type VII secretion integral membrane protein EccD [Mycobacterium sp. 1245801.1]
MPAIDTGLRRVCVHWQSAAVDVALPAEIPVAVLLPSIVDLLGVDCPDGEAVRYRLSPPAAAGLDPSMTLAQHGIADGATLLLSRGTTPLPGPRYFDVADAVAAALDPATEPHHESLHRHAVRLIGAAAAMLLTAAGGLVILRNALSGNGSRDAATTAVSLLSAVLTLGLATIAHRGHGDRTAGLALSAIATAFAGLAGFVAVPGAPGVPHVLLAAAAAAVTSVVAVRVTSCSSVTLTAVSCCTGVIALAALAGVIGGAPLCAIASAAGVVSLGLLSVAPRASIALAGLAPRLGTSGVPKTDPGDAAVRRQAVRADSWLTGLLAGLSVSAALGAIATVLAGAPRLSCTAFGTLTAALLLLRSPSADIRRTLVFAISGIIIAATTFGVTAARSAVHVPWVAAATTVSVVVAMYFGFVAPARPASPVVRRGIGQLEWLALAAMVPLTCWICGLYGAIRGVSLR